MCFLVDYDYGPYDGCDRSPPPPPAAAAAEDVWDFVACSVPWRWATATDRKSGKSGTGKWNVGVEGFNGLAVHCR